MSTNIITIDFKLSLSLSLCVCVCVWGGGGGGGGGSFFVVYLCVRVVCGEYYIYVLYLRVQAYALLIV